MHGARISERGGCEVAGRKKAALLRAQRIPLLATLLAVLWPSCTKLGRSPGKFQVPGLAAASEWPDRGEAVSMLSRPARGPRLTCSLVDCSHCRGPNFGGFSPGMLERAAGNQPWPRLTTPGHAIPTLPYQSGPDRAPLTIPRQRQGYCGRVRQRKTVVIIDMGTAQFCAVRAMSAGMV